MKAVSLFAGAGGMDTGFRQSGVEIVLASDIWELAAETYRANDPTGTEYMVGDIADIAPNIVDCVGADAPDIVAGGPPCQDFSTAGWRTGKGERADLTLMFAKVALMIRPEWILMENVNTIMSIGRRQVTQAVSWIRQAGYGITATVLNASDYGVPQQRKRFFLIAHLDGPDDEMLDMLNDNKMDPVSVREYYPDIERGDNGTSYYYRHPWSFLRRGIYGVDELSPTIRSVNRPIPSRYRPHKDDATKDLEQVRPLTTEERAIIQSFPKSYEFAGCKTDREQQIGNSVPPLLAAAVAESIQNIA